METIKSVGNIIMFHRIFWFRWKCVIFFTFLMVCLKNSALKRHSFAIDLVLQKTKILMNIIFIYWQILGTFWKISKKNEKLKKKITKFFKWFEPKIFKNLLKGARKKWRVSWNFLKRSILCKIVFLQISRER